MSNSVPNILKTVTPQGENIRTPSTINGDGGSNIFKVFLIVFMISFLAYNLYLYLYEKTDIFNKFFGINLIKNVTNYTDTPTKSSRPKNKEENPIVEKRKETPIQQAISKPTIKRKNQTNADITTESEIQQSKKGGYCYIGTDRTYRSCVKMGSDQTCTSGQIYPSLDICINPNLRR